jgi:hypothetical protein
MSRPASHLLLSGSSGAARCRGRARCHGRTMASSCWMSYRRAAAMPSRGWRSPRGGGHLQTSSRTPSIRERWQALRDERSMFPATGDEGPSESCPLIEDRYRRTPVGSGSTAAALFISSVLPDRREPGSATSVIGIGVAAIKVGESDTMHRGPCDRSPETIGRALAPPKRRRDPRARDGGDDP